MHNSAMGRVMACLAAVAVLAGCAVRDASGAVVEIVEEDGLDVFARQSDGSWKIRVSHVFTK